MAPPSWADQSQLAFLHLWLGDFMSRQGEGKLHLFWAPLHDAWFRKWPENTALGLPMPDDVDARRLTEMELATLGAAIQVKKGKLENWFCNQRKKIGSATAPLGSTFTSGALLRKMFKISAPKRRRAHQPIELFQKMYPNLITAALKEAGYNELVDRAERMSVRTRVVRALWQEASAEVVSEIEGAVDREKDEIRAEELSEETSNATGPKKMSPHELQDGIDGLESVYTQVHKATYDAAGWVGMTILGGPNPRMGGELSLKMQVRFWHSPFLCFGETPAGHDFEESCVDFDKGVWDPFEDFLRASFTYQERAERALPVRGASSGDAPLHRDIPAENAAPPKKKHSKKKKKQAQPAVAAGWRPDAAPATAPVVATVPALSTAPVLATALAMTPPLPTPASTEDAISPRDYDSFAFDDPLPDNLADPLADFDNIFFANSFDINAPALLASDFNQWPTSNADAPMENDSFASWPPSSPPNFSSSPAPSSSLVPSPSSPSLSAAAAERPRPQAAFRGATSAPMTLTNVGGLAFPMPSPATTASTSFPKRSVLFDAFTPRATLPASPATPLRPAGSLLAGNTPGFASRTARAMASIIAAPLVLGVLRTHAEPVKGAWAAANPAFSRHTRDMGPGHHQSSLDDHTRPVPPAVSAPTSPTPVLPAPAPVPIVLAPTPLAPAPVLPAPAPILHAPTPVPVVRAPSPPAVNDSAPVLPGSRPRARMPTKPPIVVPELGAEEETPDADNAPVVPQSRPRMRTAPVRKVPVRKAQGKVSSAAMTASTAVATAKKVAETKGDVAKRRRGRPRKEVLEGGEDDVEGEDAALTDTTNTAGGAPAPTLIFSSRGSNTMAFEKVVQTRRAQMAAKKKAEEEAATLKQAAKGWLELPNPNGDTPTVVLTRARRPKLFVDGSAPARQVKNVRKNPHAASEAALLARTTEEKKRKGGADDENGVRSSKRRKTGSA
ncbi:hypothetical protein C8R44DRAFT_878904 [Mycena epipterygia]|nr:hypothetical protein C8R44DRAFT_878904 [Mycena epipterygia]